MIRFGDCLSADRYAVFRAWAGEDGREKAQLAHRREPHCMTTAAPTPTEAVGSSSILDNPELAESTLIALLCNKTDPLLNYGGETPKHLVTYARRWLKLVGDEFRDEVIEGLQRKQRGLECTINHLGPVEDAPNKHWLNVKIKEQPKQEDEEASPDPTAMHMLWLSPDNNNIIWYISMCEQQRGAPDRYRAIALDAEKLRNGRLVAQPVEMPRGKIRYVELASATTALQRVHALCHIGQLHPDIAAALTTKSDEEFKERESPWQPLDESTMEPAVKNEIRRLNPGQRAALVGLDSAVTVVQGPPGTGKSSFITAACMTRVPAGLRILACTATNKGMEAATRTRIPTLALDPTLTLSLDPTLTLSLDPTLTLSLDPQPSP